METAADSRQGQRIMACTAPVGNLEENELYLVSLCSTVGHRRHRACLAMAEGNMNKH